MFKEFFDKVAKDFDAQFKSFKNLEEAKAYVKDMIAKLKRSIQYNREIVLADITVMVAEKLYPYAYDRLLIEAGFALQINKEFDIPEYVSRLNQAILNPRTITFRKVGTGKITVEIDLNATAGTLDDYGNAVIATRNILNQRKGKRRPKNYNPAWASHAWYEKYFGTAREGRSIPDRQVKVKDRRTGEITTKTKSTPDTSRYVEKYWETIKLRISNFATLAPFWEILDQGTVSLNSDVGGTAYPINVKTNFVQKAKKNILSHFDQMYQAYLRNQKEAEKNLPTLQESLNKYEDIAKTLESLLGPIPDEIYLDIKKRLYDPDVLPSIENVRKIAQRILADYERGEVRARYYSQTSGVRASVRTKTLLEQLRRM